MLRRNTFRAFALALTLTTVSLNVCAYPDDDADIDIPTLQSAAEKGDAEAQFALGSAYQMGEGVPQNDMKGVYWMKKSANQGNLDAQFNLGMAYRGGYGVPRDPVTAYMWLELAVNGGSVKAFDLRRDLSMDMPLEQIEEARYKAKRWKPEEDE